LCSAPGVCGRSQGLEKADHPGKVGSAGSRNRGETSWNLRGFGGLGGKLAMDYSCGKFFALNLLAFWVNWVSRRVLFRELGFGFA
jgi:hypothetical protein